MAGRTEANIQGECMIELSKAGCLIWRNNTGVLKDKSGRPIKFGLCVGSSDLVGICPDGIALFVECKTADGRVRPEQKSFISACRSKGARAGIARSASDALKIASGHVMD